MTKRTEKGPRLFEFDAQGRMDDEEVCRRLGVEGSAADPPADQDRADAARYRWLRNPHNWTETGLVVCSSGGEDTCYGRTLDEAIDRERGAQPVADLPAPEPLTDEQIDRKVLDTLAALQSHEAWDAMTFESGPYSINRVKYWVTKFVRALAQPVADLPAPEPLTAELLRDLKCQYGMVGTRDVDVAAWNAKLDRAIAALSAHPTESDSESPLREALQHILGVMGPKPAPCCRGCEYEWNEALKIARRALGKPA